MDVMFFQNSKIIIIEPKNPEYAVQETLLVKFPTIFWW